MGLPFVLSLLALISVTNCFKLPATDAVEFCIKLKKDFPTFRIHFCDEILYKETYSDQSQKKDGTTQTVLTNDNLKFSDYFKKIQNQKRSTENGGEIFRRDEGSNPNEERKDNAIEALKKNQKNFLKARLPKLLERPYIPEFDLNRLTNSLFNNLAIGKIFDLLMQKYFDF